VAGTVASLFEQVKAQIDGGGLEAGSQLPSTRELMAQHGLSNNGVHRAIGLLKAAGYVHARQGKGVFVADRRRLIAGAQRILGITQGSETIYHKSSERIQAPDWVAELLRSEECVNRVRTINRGDLVLQASQSWVHLSIANVVPEIDEPRACNPTWQAVYEQRSGKSVEVTSKTVSARITTSGDREALGLDDDYAVLALRSIYAADDTVIGVGEGIYAPGYPLSIS